MAKYGKKCQYNGLTFDSEPERDYYIKLEEMKEDGLIQDFSFQPNYPLQEGYETEFEEPWHNVKIKPISITPDYWVKLSSGKEILLDTKGTSGKFGVEPDSQLRRKIFQYQNRTIPLIFIAQTPKYLGNRVWVDVTPGQDFLAKLKNKYGRLYPLSKGTRKKPVNWLPKNWDEHFIYEDIDGLFYMWRKTKPAKRKKGLGKK